ncbi:MAG: ImuA family protein [Hyphomicrobiaceae bacterium]
MRVDFQSVFPLRRAHVHEVCGPGVMSFAAMATATATGCLWIRESWLCDTLTPQGLWPFFDPTRLLLARSKDQTDTLAVAEEALKDGALPFVVLEITHPLNLREGRRLQLAAKAGDATGLCLIPEGMGSNAAQTRWRAAPVFEDHKGDQDGDLTLMRWEIIKNKSGTIGAWNVRWNPKAHRVHVVSPVGE